MGVLCTAQPMTQQGLAGELTGPQPGCLCRATVSVTPAGSSRCSTASQLPWTSRSWSARWLLRNLSWKRRQVKCPPPRSCPSCSRVHSQSAPRAGLLSAPWDGLDPVTSWARTGVLAQGAEQHLPCRHASDGERRGRSRPLPTPERGELKNPQPQSEMPPRLLPQSVGKVCLAATLAHATGPDSGCRAGSQAVGGRWGRGLGERCLLAPSLRLVLLFAGGKPDRNGARHAVGDALFLLPAPVFSCHEPEPPHIRPGR